MRAAELSKTPAALSLWLGLASLGGVLCLRCPGWLTTPEVRALYPVALLRVALLGSEALALATGAMVLLRRRSVPAVLGVVATAAALLLGGSHCTLGPATPGRGLLGLDWLIADGLLVALLFLPLEKLAARLPRPSRRPAWQLDSVYFVVNHLGVHAIAVCAGLLTTTLARASGLDLGLHVVVTAPLAAQVVLALLLADLVEYWLHRAMHEVPVLWRFHAIHHSSPQLDALAGSRVHAMETLVTRGMVALAFALVGVSFTAVLIFGALITLQATLIHANVNLRYGWLEQVLVSPRFHHWHHASDREAIDTNYAGTFSWLDTLFGTRHLPARGWPRAFGVVQEQVPDSFLGQLVFPFLPTALTKDNDSNASPQVG
jgi:sterol desaturase/sphingolipid hydroxylase (fatty acid hydroxylase superfamily)